MSEVGCLKDGHFQNLEVEGTIYKSSPHVVFQYNYITCANPLVSQFGNSADGALATEDRFSILFFGFST